MYLSHVILKKENLCNNALIMTGYGTSIQAKEQGMHVIQKPFDLDTLAKAVKSTLLNPSAK